MEVSFLQLKSQSQFSIAKSKDSSNILSKSIQVVVLLLCELEVEEMEEESHSSQ
jgi:hypothetical protein